jgi:hypothetical protein
MLAMGLFLAVEPRRARLFSQIAATTVCASFVLGAQIVAMLPDRMRAAVLSFLSKSASGANAPRDVLWTPVRAAAGDWPAVLGWTVLGVAVFALACVLIGERFAQAASTPRLSPDGNRMSWLTWRHPDMPWVPTEAWVGDRQSETRAWSRAGQSQVVGDQPLRNKGILLRALARWTVARRASRSSGRWARISTLRLSLSVSVT